MFAVGIVRPEQPPIRRQCGDRRLRLRQGHDGRQDIDDRLGAQAGDRSRSDMLDRRGEPGLQDRREATSLLEEAIRPDRIVIDQDDGRIAHGSPVMRRISSGARPLAGLARGRAKLPRDGGRGCRPTSVSAMRTAQLTPSRQGTGIASAVSRARPAIGPPPKMMTSASSCSIAQHAFLQQPVAQLLLGARDVGDRHVERADAGQSAGQPVLLGAFLYQVRNRGVRQMIE